MSTKKDSSNKLQGKDLMNVGIYSAIYFVIVFAVAMLGYIPIMMPMLCVLVPLIAGVPFMLFLTKVKKFGMIWIMSIIMGILMLLTGMAQYALIIGAFSGLIAELIYKSGNYKSQSKAVLTCGVFSIWVWGNFIPLFFKRESYWAARQSFGEDYINTLNSLMPIWLCPILLAAAFVFGILGGLLGKTLLKKHFKKAGIA
ncbi:MptD family putative ECF transporter S component [Murimonas intestini]|uniref:Energy-coupling factor transport system substrate-specific component n=1 Tax=Murimonas intestini TaxID=1337051 RepID=A0AB73TAW2_9FIRM|nr:MptD family putative ECF transporter S component [Murimonas intestini]MCR1838820.1 MptD family putative ECF transporter S component [Murimonas intestini]MCR1864120.1 MptD family putative ECF transporter S component [Murimonas intestini]MCR1881730.1 MptD family putative ECF transporter S component [Murimonas intestini]